MACDLGIEITEQGEYYFISYNSGDANRVASIVQLLERKGIPMWYDKGINYGDLWEETIAKRIDSCKAMILLFTKDILSKDESYVTIEYEMAKNYFHKEIIVVYLDQIDPDIVPHNKIRWMIELNRLQGVHYYAYDDDTLFCSEMLRIVDSYYTQLLRKANEGDVISQYELGRCHYDGVNAEQSYSKAFFWFEKAAKQGYANAQHNLALCYESGIGTDVDYVSAASWYERAAKQEHATAQNHLGLCYDIGIGVEKCIHEAIHWYKRSAMNGYAGGQYNLGISYLHGENGLPDYDQAAFWLSLADENGEARAKKALMICELLRDKPEEGLHSASDKNINELLIQIPKGKLA